MGPSAPSPPPVYEAPKQPTREDPAVAQARQDELRRQQMQRGRASTLIVQRPSGEELLPAVAGKGSVMFGS